MMQRIDFLIVSGNGRNTGKTTFVCKIISQTSKSYPVTAIKVSPHFHPNKNFRNIIISDENYVICRESERDGKKDSSRMLLSGAKKVYYIEAKDSHLEKALMALLENIQITGPVICESGGMRNMVDPSLLILLNKTGRSETKNGFVKLSPLANHIIMFDGKNFDIQAEDVSFDGERWHLQ